MRSAPVFAQMRVDQSLGLVRLPRIVAACGIANVPNAKAARSQPRGGTVWGVRHVADGRDAVRPSNGRYVNGNLAEYHVPVNADIGEIDITVAPEQDVRANPLSVKGVGQIGITGVAAVIGNAV